VSLLPVKKFFHPNFEELRGHASYSVQATDDWAPAPPISAQRVGKERFVAKGGSPEEIFSDPKVADIHVRPKMVLHNQ
jgi:hypothetical protein